MIWINISNILKVDKFSGIARTEYELCLYAYTLSQQGYAIKFCTFDDCLSFIEIESQQLSGVLHNLKNDCVVKNSRLKFKPKLKRSIFKRLNALRVFCGIVSHCFRDGDLIISVGQNLGSSEMRAFEIIKKKINYLVYCCFYNYFRPTSLTTSTKLFRHPFFRCKIERKVDRGVE